MQDFSLINYKINFHEGCKVEILDDHSDNYVLEFYEKDNYSHDWLLLKGFHEHPKYSWFFFSPKRFAIKWKINIFGWENDNLKHLVQHTYSHYNKNILLYFTSDSIQEQKEWIRYIKDMVNDYNCNITIITKDYNKLFSPDPRIKISNTLPSNFQDLFDASYNIKHSNKLSDFEELQDIGYYPEQMGIDFINGGNTFTSKYNKKIEHNINPYSFIKNMLSI